jgi:hypothetical protein
VGELRKFYRLASFPSLRRLNLLQPVPGPAIYNGKYDAPSGSPPVVAIKDTGVFPEAFQKKYEALKAKEDAFALETNNKFNELNTPSGKATPQSSSDRPKAASTMSEFGKFLAKQSEKGKALAVELEELRKEAISLGIATP